MFLHIIQVAPLSTKIYKMGDPASRLNGLLIHKKYNSTSISRNLYDKLRTAVKLKSPKNF